MSAALQLPHITFTSHDDDLYGAYNALEARPYGEVADSRHSELLDIGSPYAAGADNFSDGRDFFVTAVTDLAGWVRASPEMRVGPLLGLRCAPRDYHFTGQGS
jgi:hypothetical protein